MITKQRDVEDSKWSIDPLHVYQKNLLVTAFQCPSLSLSPVLALIGAKSLYQYYGSGFKVHVLLNYAYIQALS